MFNAEKIYGIVYCTVLKIMVLWWRFTKIAKINLIFEYVAAGGRSQFFL